MAARPETDTFCVQVRLRWTFFAAHGNEEEGAGREENGYLYLLAPELQTVIPGGFSNTMFYKLMFLEVGQGYPQPWRKRRTSSVSQKGLDLETVRLEAVLIPPVSDFTGCGLNIHKLTVHDGGLFFIQCHFILVLCFVNLQ